MIIDFSEFLNEGIGNRLDVNIAYDNVLNKCKELNYELLDSKKDFQNTWIGTNNTYLKLKCNSGHTLNNTTYTKFINGNRKCKICQNIENGNKRLKSPIKFIEDCIKVNGKKYDYSNTKYTKDEDYVDILCPKHGNFSIVASSHLQGHGCKKCATDKNTEKNTTTQDIALQRLLKECGNKYKLLKAFVYINANNTILNLKCNICDNEWNTRYNDFVNSHHGCPKCAGNLEKSQEEATYNVIEQCKLLNYDLLEPFDYSIKKNKTYIHLKCNIDNNDWYIRYYNFVNSHNGCPECARKYKKSENKIKELLNDNNIKYIYQYKNNIFSRLSIDFFLPEYNIAIEYQGRQHFQSVSVFGGNEEFEKIKERDIRKYNICKENNIKILYFTYDKRILPKEYFDKIYIDEKELIYDIKNYILE